MKNKETLEYYVLDSDEHNNLKSDDGTYLNFHRQSELLLKGAKLGSEWQQKQEQNNENSWFNEYQEVENYIIKSIGNKFLEATPDKYKTASEATIALLESNWQKEKSYSEEDLHNAFYNGWIYRGDNYTFPKAKKEWIENLKSKIMKNKTKCYCGHTIYCDCNPLEQPKLEIIEEAKINNLIKLFGKDFHLEPSSEIKNCNESFMAGAKWKQERDKKLYSEEDLREAFRQGEQNISYSEIYGLDSELTEQQWFEKFYKI